MSTEFLDSLVPADPQSRKTRVVMDLMRTKNYDQDQMTLLGCDRDGRYTYYFFLVPLAIVQVEIYWDKDAGIYRRRFYDVYDDPADLLDMLGEIPD